MPKLIASHPTFAPITVEATDSVAPTLGTASLIANMVSISVAEQWQQLSPLAGGVSIFQNATISLSTTGIPTYAAANVFGAELDGNHLTDAAFAGKMGSLFFIEGEFDREGLRYVLNWIRRCIFAPPPESSVAKGGGDVTLTNPAFTGMAYKDASGLWRERWYFGTPQEALAALRERSGLT